MTLAPIRPITIAEIEAAQARIAATVLRTPLVRLDLGPGGPDIRLKLENLQPTNSYKIRGAANAVAMLSEADRKRGVWTISAGNAGQGVAYAARAAGVPCRIVVIDTAPQTKIDRMRALGAELLLTPFDLCWRALEEHAFPGMDGTLVHPFDDHDFIAGHGSMALEILDDCPDVSCVICAIGGGGLITGVGSALKAKAPHVKVLGAEPATAAPLSLSLAAGTRAGFQRVATLFRRRRRRTQRHSANVGTDEAGRGWRHCRVTRGHAPGNALDRRESAGDRGRCRCRGAGGGVERQGRHWSRRLRRQWRQRGPEDVRRTDRLLAAQTRG